MDYGVRVRSTIPIIMVVVGDGVATMELLEGWVSVYFYGKQPLRIMGFDLLLDLTMLISAMLMPVH